MVKSTTFNVSKSKKKVTEGKERNSASVVHFPTILNFKSLGVQRLPFLKLAMILVAAVAALGVVEIFLRVLEEEKYDLRKCQSLDAAFHHVMIANSTCRFKSAEWDVTYSINSLGLRDSEIDLQKKDKMRVLILGDSFVQGHGVEAEESFAEILEKRLNEDGLGRYEVINAGVFGYSPLIEYLFLKKEGLRFKPDLVIVALTLTDFFEDRQRFSELRLSYPEKDDSQILQEIAKGTVEFNWEKINPLDSRPSRFSQTIFTLKQFLKKNLRTWRELAEFWDKLQGQVQQDVIYQGDINRDIVALVRGTKITDSDWEKLWQLPVSHLTLMKEVLDEAQIPLVVVAIPDAFQISEKEWPGRSGLAIPVDFSDPRGDWQEEAVRRLSGLGINTINLTPDFRASGIYPLYFENDGHFRQLGHILCANLILKKLVNSHLH